MTMIRLMMKAKTFTDEVFAQITLAPVRKVTELDMYLTTTDNVVPAKAREGVKIEHEKKLSALQSQEYKGKDEAKIFKTKTSINRLQSIIVVTSQSVSTTSTAIIGLRDSDLVVQLVDLCHGFVDSIMSSFMSLCLIGEEISPLDPVEEEKLRNKSWFVAAGGKNPKGRVYGVGKLNHLCGDTFTQQTSTSIAVDSQKILRLEEEVRQSREEVRQSREENQRLQRKLQSLVNFVLPLLPPAAQTILQDIDEQQQNEDQNHHAQEGDQHHEENSSPHYSDY
ncbi:hypothetical protein Fmac_005779 [Flemingia macrophylla]|uniref:DUF632 domain-containing protein n=1 Tax=Flemingia macrophylla TaxID=520843 RepID=A0ABD1N8T9_9FABA